MYYVTKDLQDFSMAHRLGKGYVGKCKNLHAHNYFLQVTLSAPDLDKFDMVIDFGDIKRLLNSWVQDNWDHACMVSKSDKTLLAFLESEDQRRWVIPENQNSTAEYMSKTLFKKFSELLVGERSVRLEEVKVWETKDSFATYREPFGETK